MQHNIEKFNAQRPTDQICCIFIVLLNCSTLATARTGADSHRTGFLESNGQTHIYLDLIGGWLASTMIPLLLRAPKLSAQLMQVSHDSLPFEGLILKLEIRRNIFCIVRPTNFTRCRPECQPNSNSISDPAVLRPRQRLSIRATAVGRLRPALRTRAKLGQEGRL